MLIDPKFKQQSFESLRDELTSEDRLKSIVEYYGNDADEATRKVLRFRNPHMYKTSKGFYNCGNFHIYLDKHYGQKNVISWMMFEDVSKTVDCLNDLKNNLGLDINYGIVDNIDDLLKLEKIKKYLNQEERKFVISYHYCNANDDKIFEKNGPYYGNGKYENGLVCLFHIHEILSDKE